MTTIDGGVHADTTEEFAGRMVGAIDISNLSRSPAAFAHRRRA